MARAEPEIKHWRGVQADELRQALTQEAKYLFPRASLLPQSDRLA